MKKLYTEEEAIAYEKAHDGVELSAQEAAKIKTLESAIITTDCLVYEDEDNLENPYITIIDDLGQQDFVDDEGKASPRAKAMIAKAMFLHAQSQAAADGQTLTIIPASICIDPSGTDPETIAKIREDKIHIFDEETHLWLDNDDLDAYMFGTGLLIKPRKLVVHAPVTTAFKIGAEYRAPVEDIVGMLEKTIVTFLLSAAPFLKAFEPFIWQIVRQYSLANGIGNKKVLDRIFETVKTELRAAS